MTTNAAEQYELVARVERFLYQEAALLDRAGYEEWLALFEADATYSLPSTDVPGAEVGTSLFLINDDYQRLSGRVTRMLSRDAHADYPHPRTRRLITNVRVEPADDPARVAVSANFVIFSLRVGRVSQFVGEYRFVLTDHGDRFTIRSRRADLDLETLDFGGGKINLIV
jgi:p-cumate 2,3-dioxygenase beta subunit